MELSSIWKSILAFVALLVTNAAADWMQNGQPIPQDFGQLTRWLASIIGGTAVVYFKQNTTMDAEVAANQSVVLKYGRHAAAE